ncbi:MAG: sensor histidine kinase [Acidobacteria bacterium]|nr:MAG: sensor histidine kinase [Acidobacteriota bacterium]
MPFPGRWPPRRAPAEGGGMRARRRNVRILQVGFLALLVVCCAQVLWWVLDEARYTRRVAEFDEQLLSQQAQAAHVMLQLGYPADQVAELFPNLDVERSAPRARISRALRERLRRDRWRRLNRYGWEAGFFLLVLFAGMSVLGRALREEFRLKRRQENFLAAVSHELKSPIASLRLSAETLAMRDPPAEQRRAIVERMLDELQRLETMVTNVLDTTRIEEGRIPYEPQRVSLRRTAEAVLDELARTAAAQGVELVSEIEADVEAWVDPAAARTVVRNLTDNAVKATAAAGGGRVRLRATARSGAAELEVADTGIGIPADELGRIFDKFYRPGDELRRHTRGSGLGLYLVRRFIEIGGGTIQARSAGPGKGASFTVRWPLPPGRES